MTARSCEARTLRRRDSWLEAEGGASRRVRGEEGVLVRGAAAGLKSEEKSTEGAMAAGLPQGAGGCATDERGAKRVRTVMSEQCWGRVWEVGEGRRKRGDVRGGGTCRCI